MKSILKTTPYLIIFFLFSVFFVSCSENLTGDLEINQVVSSSTLDSMNNSEEKEKGDKKEKEEGKDKGDKKEKEEDEEKGDKKEKDDDEKKDKEEEDKEKEKPGFNPVTKDDCRNGGFEEFDFRNQGQCIRFVNTGQDSR
jgi:hypothetical protein